MTASIEGEIQELREKVYALKTLDTANEVSTHIDNLIKDTTATWEKAIKHLQNAEKALIVWLNQYKVRLLKIHDEPCQDNSPQRQPLQGIKSELKEELQNLADEVDALYNRSVTQFSKDAQSSEDTTCELDTESLKAKIVELTKKTKVLHETIRIQAFKGKPYKLTVNDTFCLTNDFVGKFGYDRPLVLHDGLYNIKSTLHVFQNPQKALCQTARFLGSNQLVLCSNKGHVTILDKFLNRPNLDDLVVIEIDVSANLDNPIYSIAETFSGSFIIGRNPGLVRIQIEPKDTLFQSMHAAEIICVQTLKDKKIATMSFDNTVQIWSDYYLYKSLERTIFGHGCTKIHCQFGVLSNDWIVTCSNDTDDCQIRVWHTDICICVKQKPAGLKQVCALAVLSNDQIVIASLDGSVKLVNLFHDSFDRVFIQPNAENHTKFIEVLPDDSVVVAGPDQSNLQIWNPKTGQLIQTYMTGHTGAITSCFLCPKKKKLVTTSLDGSVRVLEVTFRSDTFDSMLDFLLI